MKSKYIRLVMFLFAMVTIAASAMQSQTFHVLYTFNGGTDGSAPAGWLIFHNQGNLYGTTISGGSSAGSCSSFGCGTVFKLSSSGQEVVLHRFNGAGGGAHPDAGLTLGSDGYFYGTTSSGSSASRGGNVFKIDPKTGRTTVIYGFSDGKDGGDVMSGILEDSQGNLYGTTEGGGDRKPSYCQLNGCGVVFEIDKNGEKVLHTFSGPDGWAPASGLVRDAAGNLYGTTAGGGTAPCGCGTIFKIHHGKETVLYSFTGSPDGEDPIGALIRDDDGNLYGTTYSGGEFGLGTVFRLDPAGQLTILHSFAGADGANPDQALARDSAGNFYGTTYAGGDSSCGFQGSGCGVVFRLDSNQNITVLHAFTGMSDGGWPLWGSLVLDAAGNLYGLASGGGNQFQGVSSGVVFEITP